MGKGGYQTWSNFLEKFNIPHAFVGDWDNIVNFGIITQSEIEEIGRGIINADKKVNNELNKKNSQDKTKWLEVTDQVLNAPNPENLANLASIRAHIINRHLPYKQIVDELRTNNPDKYIKILESIRILREQKIFILCNGELEDYLSIKKGTDSLIAFIQHDFDYWRSAHPNEYQELKEIIIEINIDK